jgi:hypothetical protein
MKYVALLCFMCCMCFSLFARNNAAYISATSGLKMRSDPTLSSNVLVVIPYQGKVEILEILKDTVPMEIQGRCGYWCKVKWGEYTGYVFGGFLELAPGAELLRELPKSWIRIQMISSEDYYIIEYPDNYTEKMIIKLDAEFNYAVNELPYTIVSDEKPHLIALFGKHVNNFYIEQGYEDEVRVEKWSP